LELHNSVSIFPGPLARLPNEEVALLTVSAALTHAPVAIALTKLDTFVHANYIISFRAPWGPLVACVPAVLECRQLSAPAGLYIVSWTQHLTQYVHMWHRGLHNVLHKFTNGERQGEMAISLLNKEMSHSTIWSHHRQSIAAQGAGTLSNKERSAPSSC
jgi:hypothetical protein